MVSAPVGSLIAEIERFCARPSPVAGDELAADLRELARGRNLLDLKFSDMAAAFARTDHYDAEGCLSPIHWLRLNCHMTSGAAADRGDRRRARFKRSREHQGDGRRRGWISPRRVDRAGGR